MLVKYFVTIIPDKFKIEQILGDFKKWVKNIKTLIGESFYVVQWVTAFLVIFDFIGGIQFGNTRVLLPCDSCLRNTYWT